MGQPSSYSIPAPTGGWNAKDALDTMDENQAIRLDNYFPDTSAVILRNGFRSHSTGIGTGTSQIQTLAEYAAASGARHLIAAAANKIYNASTYGVAATNITGAAVITINKWQTINFRATGTAYLIMVNGTDQPLCWDGSTLASATYTGAGLTDDKLINISSYKRRVYLVEKDTTKAWYGASEAYSGACTEYDFASLFLRGGYLNATATWSRDGGSGPQDLFVAISSMGEVLIYSGDDPSAANWSLVGRYFTAPPLGRRCTFSLDSDLILVTLSGLTPMSGLASTGETGLEVPKLSDNIQKAFNSAAASYQSNFGWQPCVYHRGHFLLVNIPVVEGSQQDQAVMNLLTGSWCRFTGLNASSWTVYNDKLYFGGNDGVVYEADYGGSDNGANIVGRIKTAFSYFGDRLRAKKYTLLRPVMAATEGMSFDLNIDVDFGDRTINNDIVIDGSSGEAWSDGVWDVSEWEDDGTAQILNWYGVDGIGRCMAVRLESESQNAEVAITAFSVVYEPGGVL